MSARSPRPTSRAATTSPRACPMPSGWPRARASNSRRAEPVGLTAPRPAARARRWPRASGSTRRGAGAGRAPPPLASRRSSPSCGSRPRRTPRRSRGSRPMRRGGCWPRVSDDKTLRLWDLPDGALRARAAPADRRRRPRASSTPSRSRRTARAPSPPATPARRGTANFAIYVFDTARGGADRTPAGPAGAGAAPRGLA